MRTKVFFFFIMSFVFIINSRICLCKKPDYFIIQQEKYINPGEEVSFFDLKTFNVSDVIQMISRNLEKNISLSKYDTLLITTLTDLNNFNITCKLARIIQEGIASYFTREGYKVKEIRLRNYSLLIKKKRGEFALSRDLSLILSKYKSNTMLTGTYVQINNNLLFITLKIISLQNNVVLSSISFTLFLPEEYQSLILPERIKELKKKKKEKITKAKIEGGPIELGVKILSKFNKDDIKLIQKRLKELGLYNLKIDGIWGKETQKAMETFKKIIGITPYNKWDLQTQKRLFKGTNM
ncbi:hypothetical protein JCM12298_11790 [Desulfothermus naphthae]